MSRVTTYAYDGGVRFWLVLIIKKLRANFAIYNKLTLKFRAKIKEEFVTHDISGVINVCMNFPPLTTGQLNTPIVKAIIWISIEVRWPKYTNKSARLNGKKVQVACSILEARGSYSE